MPSMSHSVNSENSSFKYISSDFKKGRTHMLLMKISGNCECSDLSMLGNNKICWHLNATYGILSALVSMEFLLLSEMGSVPSYQY